MSDVADGWQVAPLGQLSEIAIGGTPSRDVSKYWASDGDDGEPWVSIRDMTQRVLFETKERITSAGVANSNVKRVPAQTVLMSFKLSLGKVAVAGTDLYTNEAIAAFRPGKALDSRFLYYALPDAVRRTATDVAIKGATLNKASLAAIPLWLPALPIQQRIAAIITNVDTAIESTEALIAKHQQIKAGLMHDLFTRGLSTTGRIGQRGDGLPSGWRWVPLGDVARVVGGVTLGGAGPANGVVVPYLRVANVQDGYLALEEVKTIRVSRAVLEELRLLPGDALMNEGGDFDKLGRGTVWSGEIDDCIHQNHVFRVRTDRSVLNPEYLAFHSESHYGKRYFLISSKQSTNLASINATQLRRYPIALPPLDEQARIVARLSAANAHLSGLEGSVAKLRAQKLGLMQDLLTGKVRVPLPEPEVTA